MNHPNSPQTAAVRAGLETDRQHGAIMPPLYLSSNFSFKGFNEPRAYDYTRSGNPTRDQLAEALAAWEGGCGAVVTSTGMSAITLCLQLLQPGDLLVAARDCYGGTHRLFTHLAGKNHFVLRFIDMTDSDQVDRAVALKPRLVWIETPSNPLLRITDIAGIATKVDRSTTLVAVDNTLLSPALQQPIRLGADLVVHSTTKYINGHSDVVGGAVVARTEQLLEPLKWWANCLGLTGSPFDSYLTLRGLRTLDARIQIHCRRAAGVARVLNAHEAVAKVHYPGLKTHPDHDLARKQQKGYGGLVSFELKGGAEAVARFVKHLSCFSLAESLGGVESLVAHPATMTHAAMDPDARKTAGIGDGLVRLSVGIESGSDLCSDVLSALTRLVRNHPKRARPLARQFAVPR